MTKDEIDTLWQKAMQESIKDGEMFTRYHFAELVEDKALAEHAMSEVQRLGQEIEQEPVAWVSEDVCKGQYIDGRPRKIWWECEKGVGTAFYTTPPQRTEQEPVCPDCKAKVLYECVACSSNNYPPKGTT